MIISKTKISIKHLKIMLRPPGKYWKLSFKSCAKFHQIYNHKLILTLQLILLCNFITYINCTPCTPCDIKNEIGKNAGPAAKAAYEEYVFEHQVTKQEAIEALKLLNDSFFNDPISPGCKAIDCSKKVMKYCLGGQFLNDHCWCDQRHGKEGLPFIPHTCYVGERDVGASVGSCYFYTEVKECCCVRALAKRWKYMSSAPKLTNNLLLTICVILFVKILNRNFKFKLK